MQGHCNWKSVLAQESLYLEYKNVGLKGPTELKQESIVEKHTDKEHSWCRRGWPVSPFLTVPCPASSFLPSISVPHKEGLQSVNRGRVRWIRVYQLLSPCSVPCAPKELGNEILRNFMNVAWAAVGRGSCCMDKFPTSHKILWEQNRSLAKKNWWIIIIRSLFPMQPSCFILPHFRD